MGLICSSGPYPDGYYNPHRFHNAGWLRRERRRQRRMHQRGYAYGPPVPLPQQYTASPLVGYQSPPAYSAGYPQYSYPYTAGSPGMVVSSSPYSYASGFYGDYKGLGGWGSSYGGARW